VKLTLRDNLNDWNTYIGGNNCRAALRGNDAQGSLFGFYAIDWRNPRPQTAIREFVVASKPDSGAALALFAISLSNAAAAPAGEPTAAVLATVPPRRPEAALTPVADFGKGIPAGAKVLGTSIPGFRYRLIDDPKGGKMLEFIVPETKGKFARCLIDIPVKVPADFKYVTFDVEVSDPSAVRRDHLGHCRADVYFLKPAGGHTKTIGALGYAPTLDEKRHTVTLPRELFTVKEFGGLDPVDAEQLRVGFFLNSPVKPLTIRVGNVSFCDRPRAGRAVVKTPVL